MNSEQFSELQFPQEMRAVGWIMSEPHPVLLDLATAL
jgi:hypothetical protein